MYHYVRDPEESRYRGMKARRVSEFLGQLDYIAQRFHVVALDEVVAAFEGVRELPQRACLLTFDDGLRDHVDVVLPALLERGLPAVFSASGMTVVDRRVADAQKIQLVLALEPDHKRILRQIVATSSVRLPRVDDWRFDPPETAQVKVLLASELLRGTSVRLLDELFQQYVGSEEAAVADELYLTLDDMHKLRDAGMALAGHGWTHRSLDVLSIDQVEDEVAKTRTLLSELGVTTPWAFVYPSGAWNENVVDVLRRHGASVAFTTEATTVRRGANPLKLPRLDTNDLPLTA
jgi:peptidoglycan/xylan/chitin deacetylase (PgdA/CDA1 family)